MSVHQDGVSCGVGIDGFNFHVRQCREGGGFIEPVLAGVRSHVINRERVDVYHEVF